MKNRTKHIYATAHHEAGHAFADWKCGFKVKQASVVPNTKQNSLGHVLSRTGLHFRSLEYTEPSGSRIGRLHDRVVCLLAGEAAQRRYRPSSVRRHQAESDRKNAVELLVQLHPANERPYVWRYLKAKAENLVGAQMSWFVIKHLACELLKRRAMTGTEVEAAIRAGYDRHLQWAQKARARRDEKARAANKA